MEYSDKIRIIGHRGSTTPFPENTLEAVLHGILAGASMVEIDLRLTQDNEVVLSHDENLLRMTGMNLNISENKWENLSQAEITRGKNTFHLSSLKDIIKTLPEDIHLYLELKALHGPRSSSRNEKLVDEVISIIKKATLKKQCILMSFDLRMVKYVKDKYPSYRAGLIVNSKNILNDILKARKFEYDCLSIDHKLLTINSMPLVKSLGVPVIAWTVNTQKYWVKMLSLEPFGIVTDFPEKFGTAG